MAEKANIRIGVTGVPSVLRAYGALEGGSNRMSRRVRGNFRKMTSATSGWDRSLKTVGRAMAAVGAARVLKDGAKRILNTSEAISSLQTAANLSDAEAKKLHTSIFDIAKAANTMPADVLEGFSAIQDFSGDLDFARSNMLAIAKAARGTDTPMGTLALIANDLNKKTGATGAELERMLGTIILQGDKASIPLKELAVEMSELTALASSFGFGGAKGVRDIVAVAETLRGVTGSASEATTLTKALFRELPKAAPKLKRLGINVFEKRDGKKVLRDIDVIINEIARKLGGDRVLAGKVFGSEEAAAAAAGFADAGPKEGLKLFNDLTSTIDDGSTIARKFGVRTEGEFGKIGAAVNDLKILHEEANEALLRGGVSAMADYQDEFRSLVEFIGKEGKEIGEGVGAPELVQLLGGGAALAGLSTLFKKGLPPEIAGLVSGVGEARVFVTNWPESLGGGAADAATSGAAAAAGGVAARGLPAGVKAAGAAAGALGPIGAAVGLGAFGVGAAMKGESERRSRVLGKLDSALAGRSTEIESLRGSVASGAITPTRARKHLRGLIEEDLGLALTGDRAFGGVAGVLDPAINSAAHSAIPSSLDPALRREVGELVSAMKRMPIELMRAIAAGASGPGTAGTASPTVMASRS